MNVRKTKKRSSGVLLSFLLCCLSLVTMISIYRRESDEKQSAKNLVKLSERKEEQETAGGTTDSLGKQLGGGASMFELDQDAHQGKDALATAAPTTQPAPKVVREASSGNVLSFGENDTLVWPVQGEVLMEYSMDATVYFATLNQYKYNPGILIQSEAGAPVYACCDARVMDIGESDELGKTVTLDLGNAYTVIYGQLTDIAVSKGDYVATGATIATVAQPTKYYAVEQDCVYMEVRKGEQTVDPLEYLQ